jgi:hypothetical protein
MKRRRRRPRPRLRPEIRRPPALIEDGDERFTEGNAAQVRDAAAVNKMPGHTGSLPQWEASDAGKRFVEKVAPAREKVVQEQAKSLDKQREESARLMEALPEAEKKVQETAEADRKAAEKDEKAKADRS